VFDKISIETRKTTNCQILFQIYTHTNFFFKCSTKGSIKYTCISHISTYRDSISVSRSLITVLRYIHIHINQYLHTHRQVFAYIHRNKYLHIYRYLHRIYNIYIKQHLFTIFTIFTIIIYKTIFTKQYLQNATFCRDYYYYYCCYCHYFNKYSSSHSSSS